MHTATRTYEKETIKPIDNKRAGYVEAKTLADVLRRLPSNVLVDTLARIGYLMLREGQWNGKEILKKSMNFMQDKMSGYLLRLVPGCLVQFGENSGIVERIKTTGII